jgi:hypothetical protein
MPYLLEMGMLDSAEPGNATRFRKAPHDRKQSRALDPAARIAPHKH